MPSLSNSVSGFVRLVSFPWTRRVGPLPGKLIVFTSALGGALLGVRWMWNRMSPLLHWPARYSVIERAEKITDQKKLLANPVYQHSGSFLVISGILGATTGYIFSSILFWLAAHETKIPSSAIQFVTGGWTGALLHTIFLFQRQLASLWTICYNWALGIQTTPNRPKDFKLELYDKVFHKHWFGTDPNIDLFTWTALSAIAYPGWLLVRRLA